jgi:beta-1,4-mannosyltransferase
VKLHCPFVPLLPVSDEAECHRRITLGIGGERMNRMVWQVPEICDWNPYVAKCDSALGAAEWELLSPGVCVDSPGAVAGSAWSGPAPAIIHLHWPDKLSTSLGERGALTLLRSLKLQGSRLVQTVHNVMPHEATEAQRRFIHAVDELSDGVHFFSFEHETAARHFRPNLPQTCVHFPHPQFGQSRPLQLGLIGRLRGYKRTAAFLKVLLTEVLTPIEIQVVGNPDDEATAHALRGFAKDDDRLLLDLRFRSAPGFAEAIASVDWVVLPYERLYSSGIAVAALEMGRGLISPVPIGGTSLYGSAANRWITLDPWNDHEAAARIDELARAVQPWLALPTWDEAAASLSDFYTRLLAVSTAERTEP